MNAVKIGELIIDDTPLDLSDALVFSSEEEEDAYWESIRREVREAKAKNTN